MFVVPMKWMPFLLVIAGVFALFTGEMSVLGSLVMIAVGGGWLWLRYGLAPKTTAPQSEQ